MKSAPKQQYSTTPHQAQPGRLRAVAAGVWAWSRVPLGLLFIAAAGFALADFVTIAVVDLDFALAKPGPGAGFQAAAFVYLLASGLAGAWRLRRKLLLIVPVLWLLVGVAVWFDNTQTHEDTEREMLLEVLPAVSDIRKALEQAHKSGLQPATVDELAERGFLKVPGKLNQRYFGPEAYSFEAAWQNDVLTGRINVQGDASRNVPDWVATFDGGRGGKLEHGDIRPNLPVIERPAALRKASGKRQVDTRP